MTKTKVWDLPTRIFHWLLAASVITSIGTGMSGAMYWHFRSGYLVLSLLLFRWVWGFVGAKSARFLYFVKGYQAIRHYLASGVNPSLGHSPIAAIATLGILCVLTLQVASGLFADDEIMNTGPLARYVSSETSALLTFLHAEVFKVIVMLTIVAHIIAVCYYWLVRKQNLILAMFSGEQNLTYETEISVAITDNWKTRLLALTIFSGWLALVLWFFL